MDANGVVSAVFIAATGSRPAELRLQLIGWDPPPTSAPGQVEANAVWSRAFDPATNSLRVVAV